MFWVFIYTFCIKNDLSYIKVSFQACQKIADKKFTVKVLDSPGRKVLLNVGDAGPAERFF